MASELRKIHFFHTAQVMQSHLFRAIHSHHHGIGRIGSISMAAAIGILFQLPVTPFDEPGQVAGRYAFVIYLPRFFISLKTCLLYTSPSPRD